MPKKTGFSEKRRLTTSNKKLRYWPEWFYFRDPRHVIKPHSVSTRMLVEDEQGTRYAKAAVARTTQSRLQNLLPMGASPYMPIYILFVKAVNLKVYSVYACYSDKLRYPLFYVKDISELGKLWKVKEK